MPSSSDLSLADFPRLPGENNDSPRIQRAIQACASGVLYIPRGVYEIAEPIIITNLCSLELHKSAILKAVKKMDFVLAIDGRLQHDKTLRSPDAPEDYNLFLRGGEIDGNGLAGCLLLCYHHHFTFADTTLLNGYPCGLQLEKDDSHGYELIANNIYCKTVIPGLAGNIAMDLRGGDSHFTDIVVVDYTIGFRLTREAWSNRLTRCHVWGGPLPPVRPGEYPEMLKDSICFEIHVSGNILRDCYADTGVIGYLVDSDTRLFGCSYFSNPVFKLDSVVCIQHKSGPLTVSGCNFSKTMDHIKIYEGTGENLCWEQNLALGFSPEEIPFSQGNSKPIPGNRLA